MIMDKNILMMKSYADEIIKILNKSYYIYNIFVLCLIIFHRDLNRQMVVTPFINI